MTNLNYQITHCSQNLLTINRYQKALGSSSITSDMKEKYKKKTSSFMFFLNFKVSWHFWPTSKICNKSSKPFISLQNNDTPFQDDSGSLPEFLCKLISSYRNFS